MPEQKDSRRSSSWMPIWTHAVSWYREYPGQRMPRIIMLGGFHLTSLPAHASMDPHQIRKNGTWYYLLQNRFIS